MGIHLHNDALQSHSAGIYYLRNCGNNKIYIGMTGRSFALRWQEHAEALHEGKHHNRAMQADYNRGDAFAAGILCILRTPALVERAEQALITYYKDREELYNVLGNTLPFDFYERIPNDTAKKGQTASE